MAALQFLGKYREVGLLLLRTSLGLLFIYLTAPVLMGGEAQWARFGSGIRVLEFDSHFKVWGFLGALAGCVGGVLMIFGLFFRIGVLLALALTLVYALALSKSSAGFRAAFPAIEMCVVLTSLLLIGPGKFSVDKT